MHLKQGFIRKIQTIRYTRLFCSVDEQLSLATTSCAWTLLRPALKLWSCRRSCEKWLIEHKKILAGVKVGSSPAAFQGLPQSSSSSLQYRAGAAVLSVLEAPQSHLLVLQSHPSCSSDCFLPVQEISKTCPKPCIQDYILPSGALLLKGEGRLGKGLSFCTKLMHLIYSWFFCPSGCSIHHYYSSDGLVLKSRTLVLGRSVAFQLWLPTCILGFFLGLGFCCGVFFKVSVVSNNFSCCCFTDCVCVCIQQHLLR